MQAPQFSVSEAIEILERTPAVLRALLADLGDQWIAASAGPHTFNSFDVLGHLIHGEQTDWIPRTHRILEHGPSLPFERYDRYAQFEASRGKSARDLLDEFESHRRASIAELRRLRLTPALLARQGRHAALGEVTLAQLLATWVAHDLNHIAQIAKALASRYAADVGPWREYLAILKTPAAEMDADGQARAGAPGAARGPRPAR